MIPRIAIIDKNTLEAMGLMSIISDIIPRADISVFTSVQELKQELDEAPFFHYFVSSQILLENSAFFLKEPSKTIVLTTQPMASTQFANFHTLNPSLLEPDLVKSLLTLHDHGHANPQGHGYHHGNLEEQDVMQPSIPISKREAEVLALVVKGYINKEIADHLCISLPTVISHRKNICEKLNMRSVSALTIYAVTHGLVNIDDI